MNNTYTGFYAFLLLVLIMTGYKKSITNDEKLNFSELKIENVLYDSIKSENADNPHAYLGQKSPGMKPEKFAPNLISKNNEHEFGSVFSKDATEFYYGVDIDSKAEIRFTRLENSTWTPPAPLITHERFSFNDPFLSPDENRLYYISNKSRDGSADPKDYDIWYSIRNDSGWSEPIHAGDSINSDWNEYYISFTKDGSIYFGSNSAADEERKYDYDIYTSKFENGTFQVPVRLGESINSRQYEADVFISPDESYMIFSSVRRDGYGQGDLYISFKTEDGNWTEAKNMEGLINTTGHELSPFVTRDGNYFFYTSDGNIYWIDAEVLKKL